MTWFFIASENASPSSDLAYRPAACARASKARLLYQPAVAVRLSDGAFSNDTPNVAAPQPNAATTRDTIPYPPDAPSISAFFVPLGIAPRDLIVAICESTCAAQPFGCAVVQMKPRTRGLMIIAGFV